MRDHRRHERPRPERRDPGHAGADRRLGGGRARGGRGDRAHPRPRSRDRQAGRRPRVVQGGPRRDRRALRRDRPADERRRGRDDDRGARPRRDRVPAGDGDVQLRLVQLRDLPRAPPAGDGRVGGRVPRVDARLRLQEHLRRSLPALGAVPRGRDEARVRGLRRRPPLQPRPSRRAGAGRLPAARPVRARGARRERRLARPARAHAAHGDRAVRRGPLHLVGGRGGVPRPVPPRRRGADAGRAHAGRAGGQPARHRRTAAPGRTRSWSRRRSRWPRCSTASRRTPARPADCWGWPVARRRCDRAAASPRASGACASPWRRACRRGRAAPRGSAGAPRRARRGPCPAARS